MNIIKISREVFDTLINNEMLHVDINDVILYYNKLTIAFPYEYLRSSEIMIEDALREFKRKANENGMGYKQALKQCEKELEIVKKKIINYCNTDLILLFNVYCEKVYCTEIIIKHPKPELIDGKDKILFHGIVEHTIENLLDVKVNKMCKPENAMGVFRTFLKIVSGIIYALQNPVYVEVTESNQRVVNNTHKYKNKNKKKFDNIRYISNIKYIKKKGKGNKTGTRVIKKEAWEVEGHPRHYKSGKTIWIKSYIKGDKTKLVKEKEQDKILKMNKIAFPKVR